MTWKTGKPLSVLYLGMDEKELIIALKAGDQSAFKLLIKLHGNKVLNTCYRFLLDKQDAEDLSQEVFLQIHQSLPKFRGEAKLSTWIYRITISKCLDEIKSRKRKKRITSIGKFVALEKVAFWLLGNEHSDQQLLLDESMRNITNALDRLPDNQRVAFTLSKMEGYSNTEIADIMQTSNIAVETLISRAKKKMMQALSNPANPLTPKNK